jgi:hypothetical protein
MAALPFGCSAGFIERIDTIRYPVSGIANCASRLAPVFFEPYVAEGRSDLLLGAVTLVLTPPRTFSGHGLK